MFTTYQLNHAVPVRVAGFPYGVALALPPFLGRGYFQSAPDLQPTEDDFQQERWEDDGGPCTPDEG